MASKRQRKCGSWEFLVKNSKYLAKPLYLTFSTESEGDEYCRRLEALFKNGIVPEEFRASEEFYLLRELIRHYCCHAEITEGDRKNLSVLVGRIGLISIHKINFSWAEKWVTQMKVELNIPPSTIKHHVGALARCLDWSINRKLISLHENPLRKLDKKYAVYGRKDMSVIDRTAGKEYRSDVARNRRFQLNEESKIRQVLNREVMNPGDTILKLPYQLALNFLFDMALETAMRLSEIYTLQLNQVDVALRTIHLEKTKNGDTREVPMTSTIIERFEEYKTSVLNGDKTMNDFSFDRGFLFPWVQDLNPQSLTRVSANLSKQFSRVFQKAKVPNFRFHDLRHEATSRFFEKTAMDSVEIAKITGHKDPKMLMIYANLRGSNLAQKLW